MKCECEDSRHFDGPSHDYGVAVSEVVKIKTDYGRFWVCRECEHTCNLIDQCRNPECGVCHICQKPHKTSDHR